MKPKLREHIYLIGHDTDKVTFFCSHRSKILAYDVDACGEKAILSADGEKDVSAIYELLPSGTKPRMSDLAGFFEALVEEGVLRDASLDHGTSFPASYEVRLNRQINYFSAIAPGGSSRSMQSQLLHSRVLVIGAGGAGSHLAVQLAAMGVGHLTIVDPDRVEASNLSRQIYYAGKVGLSKVSALKEFIVSLAPEIEVDTHELALTENAPWLDQLVLNADLVLNCADFPSMAQTSRWLFDACYRREVPFMPVGGYNGHMSVVPPTVLPGRSTCWYCHEKARNSTSSPADHGIQLSSLPLGSFLPAVAATANIQAMEVVRILTGFESPRHCGRWGEFNLLNCTLEWEDVQPNPDCSYCTSAAFDRTASPKILVGVP